MQIVVINYEDCSVTKYVLSKSLPEMDVLGWLLKHTDYNENYCYWMCSDTIVYNEEYVDV